MVGRPYDCLANPLGAVRLTFEKAVSSGTDPSTLGGRDWGATDLFRDFLLDSVALSQVFALFVHLFVHLIALGYQIYTMVYTAIVPTLCDNTVKTMMFRSSRFSFFLSICSLSIMLWALLAQDFEVREYAISVAGRLSEKNPAYVLPALRRHLIQLLTYLKQRQSKRLQSEKSIRYV